MRKIAMLLLLTMLLSLAACGGNVAESTPVSTEQPVLAETQQPTEPVQTLPAATEPTVTEPLETLPWETEPVETEPEMVTIYIPTAYMFYDSNGEELAIFSLEYEAGWEDKESFTVTCDGDAAQYASLGIGNMVYGDCWMTLWLNETVSTTSTYDAQGRVIVQETQYGQEMSLDKVQILFTYDEQGRLLTKETITYLRSGTNPEPLLETYTYGTIEEGYLGSCTLGTVTYEREYDLNGRLLGVMMLQNGRLLSRDSYLYDQLGNQVNHFVYSNGELTLEVRIRYKAVEVPASTAARLPQFCR